MAKQTARVCIDRVVPDQVSPARAMTERALREIVPDKSVPQAGGAGRLSMALPVLKKWPNGTEVKCEFLDGSLTQRKRVEAKAHDWEQFANIRFKFVSSGSAEVRI